MSDPGEDHRPLLPAIPAEDDVEGVFDIRSAWFINPDVKRFRIGAPRVARHWRPGQFVIVRVDADGERVPFTVAEVDRDEGWIGLVVQAVGMTTRAMNRLEAGDALHDVAGPLGTPTSVERFGTVAVVGGGVGAAIAYPSARALHEAGNTVLGILGGRSSDHVVLAEEMAEVCDDLVVVTDDGSRGRRGLVTDALSDLLVTGPAVDRVLAIGPVPMMRAVADVTRPYAIPTVVSLNPIMVDGTGMCGGCRVLIGGQTRFACVDGPEFDAHLVDFDTLTFRNRAFRRQEEAACSGGAS